MSVALLILMLAPPQQLTWYEHYERGEKHFRRGDWESCIADMDAALAEKGEAKKNQFTRAVQKIDYKPFYYKALSTFELGNLSEALDLADRAIAGEVVADSAQFQSDLARIYVAVREDAINVSRRYNQERRIIAERERLLGLLASGDLDAVAEALAAQSDQTAFSDIQSQLNLARAFSSREQSINNDLTNRIETRITNGDREGAELLLSSFRARLTLEQQADFDQRIAVIPQITEERVEAEAPPEVVDNREEILAIQARYDDLTREVAVLKQGKEALDRKNRNLTLQLETAQNQNDENAEAAPLAFSPQPFLSLTREGLRRIRLNGHVISALPLVEWKIALNNRELPFPEATLSVEGMDYNFEHVLEVDDFGPQNISITVIDELRGEPVTIQEQLNLTRPLYLQPILWIVLGSGLILLLAMLFIKQKRRRQLATLRHFNPYIAGSPVRTSDMFFGREALIKRIQGQVHKNSFMIHGERRIGKTSMLLQLKTNLAAMGTGEYCFFPVFIDLQGISESELFHHMMSEVVHELAEQGIDPGALAFDEGGNEGYTSRRFSRDIKTVIGKLKDSNAGHVMVVLLMDEVDCLNEFGEKTNQKLRGIFMKDFAEHLTCVMAGIHLKKEWESSGSPWYNFFEEIPVHHIKEEDARALIVNPVKGIFRFKDEAVARIIKETGGHPYLIQKICVSLIAHLLNEARFVISETDVGAVLASVTEASKKEHA